MIETNWSRDGRTVNPHSNTPPWILITVYPQLANSIVNQILNPAALLLRNAVHGNQSVYVFVVVD